MAYENSIHSREVVRTPRGFPVKMYTFNIAFDAFRGMTDIREYLLSMIHEHPEITVRPHLYAIAAPWGYKDHGGPVRVVDILSYAFDRSWGECNPDIDAWVFKNGIYRPEDRGLTCETTTIILGKEGELRRKTASLEEYLNAWPDTGELGPAAE